MNTEKEYTLKGKFETRTNKNGKEYVVFVAKLSPTCETLIFLTDAERELIRLNQR